MIEQSYYFPHFQKNTKFAVLDVSKKYIQPTLELTTLKHFIYINKTADGDTPNFVFNTYNNSIEIYKDKKENRYNLKFYNCDKKWTPLLSGLGSLKVAPEDLVEQNGFQYIYYYGNLKNAIEDSIKAILDLEQGIVIYGSLFSEYFPDNFFLENDLEDMIRFEGLKILARSQKRY